MAGTYQRSANANPPAASELFGLIRSTLIDVMGSTSFAVLLRRAVTRASAYSPELSQIAVTRVGLAYDYRLPDSWDRPGEYGALRELVGALLPMSAEISGRFVARRVVALPALAELDIISPSQIALWRAE
jgi:hypothetical protein